MNFLAHIALSGDNTDIMIGNFVGDFIKGNAFNNYPKDLKKGMLLHRAIDSFTDNHPLTLKSKRRFYKEFPKFGGIITDIIYDYFLCQHWNKFYSIELDSFIANTYKTLEENKYKFPKEMDNLYLHLTTHDWFKRYKTQEGTSLSLKQIGSRMNYSKDLSLAFDIVNGNIDLFYDEFDVFYRELKNFCVEFIKNN
jgi:acyl carrier protein phosphodiesterase